MFMTPLICRHKKEKKKDKERERERDRKEERDRSRDKRDRSPSKKKSRDKDKERERKSDSEKGDVKVRKHQQLAVTWLGHSSGDTRCYGVFLKCLNTACLSCA